MPDLGTGLRAYIDAAADPITLDEVSDVRLEPVRRRPLRWLVIAAAVLVAVGVVAIVATATRPDEHRVVTDATVTVPFDPSWLTKYGDETPMPAIPAGWKVIDFGPVRFAAPATWRTPTECRDPLLEYDVLVVASAYEDDVCGPSPPSSPSVVRVEPARSTARNLAPATVGTLRAKQFIEKCVGCPPHYRLGLGYDVTATGPFAEEVLATFTESGLRRTLQDGPVADSSGWRTVSYRDVALRVPQTWIMVDTDAPGATEDPSPCGTRTFPLGRGPFAFVGFGNGMCEDPYEEHLDLDAADGVWFRAAGGDPPGPMVTRGRIGGLLVTVVDTYFPVPFPDPAVDLIVETGEHWVWLTLGVGRDASVARAILRSLHHA